MEQAETFYHELKQLRIAQGISLEDISARTRINVRFLEALERGEFGVLPKTYMRLFLRSYCKGIGADEKEALEQLEEHLGGPEDRHVALLENLSATVLSPPQRDSALQGEARGPARLRRDLLAGGCIFLFLIAVTFFARRIYQKPSSIEPSTAVSTTSRTETLPAGTTPQPVRRTQPVVPLESAVELPDELFTTERIASHHMERIRLTPPVRLTLMARDKVVIQPVTDGQRGPSFNLVVADARTWTIQEELVIRTNAIELLRGDLNGIPINLGQASGIGALRVTPSGEYEVFAYADTSR